MSDKTTGQGVEGATVSYQIEERRFGRWCKYITHNSESMALDALRRLRNMSNTKYRLVKATREVIDYD